MNDNENLKQTLEKIVEEKEPWPEKISEERGDTREFILFSFSSKLPNFQ